MQLQREGRAAAAAGRAVGGGGGDTSKPKDGAAAGKDAAPAAGVQQVGVTRLMHLRSGYPWQHPSVVSLPWFHGSHTARMQASPHNTWKLSDTGPGEGLALRRMGVARFTCKRDQGRRPGAAPSWVQDGAAAAEDAQATPEEDETTRCSRKNGHG